MVTHVNSFGAFDFNGFICGTNGSCSRRIDPKRAQQPCDWPIYVSCEDVSSPLAFAVYSQEYVGHGFHCRTKPLLLCLKEGVDFSQRRLDLSDRRASTWLPAQVPVECVVVALTRNATERPRETGYSFKAYLGASDESQCVALRRRLQPESTPRLMAFICKPPFLRHSYGLHLSGKPTAPRKAAPQ